MNKKKQTDREAAQWGLPLEEITKLGKRLRKFCSKYSSSLRTQTHDKVEYGYRYVSGLIRIEAKRNMANIGRKTGVPEQNMQHFMSESPWSGRDLIAEIREDVKAHPEFQTGAILVIDESANEKAGGYSAGAGRQHNGRLGKIEMSQVGVFGALVTPRVNTWIDGELYYPERWFGDDFEERREKIGMPENLTFKTKPELAWEIIQRAKNNNVPF
jgi:SRSO17 transposase